MITLRPYTHKDCDALHDLYETSLRENPNGFVQDPAFHGPLKDQCHDITMGGGVVFVAETLNTQEIVGMGALILQQSLHRPVTWELGKLHVKSSHQGRGIGRALVEHMVAFLDNRIADRVELHVTTSQKRAIKLYEKIGFIPYQTKTYYVQDGAKQKAFETVFMHCDLSRRGLKDEAC